MTLHQEATPAKSGEPLVSADNNTPSKEATSTNASSVNTEKTGENKASKTECTILECGLDNTITTYTVNAENSIVNAENNVASPEKKTIDNEINKERNTEASITTENIINKELSTIPNDVNTVNITEADKEITSVTNNSNMNDLLIKEHDGINVNTEKISPNQDKPMNSTPITHNQKIIKEDWSSLMFSNDDSLFDEMTKQLKEDTTGPEINRKSSRKSPTSTISRASTSTQDQETLPVIVYTGNRTVTGLLMLGADPKDLDTEIDNKLIMLAHKPKQPDLGKSDTDASNREQKKENKRKKKKQSHDKTESPRRSTCQTNKPTTTETTSTTSILPSSPTSPRSPRGVLKVTCYELRKGTPNKYIHKPLKCSMCDQEVNSKDELQIHHQEIHNISSCKECG